MRFADTYYWLDDIVDIPATHSYYGFEQTAASSRCVGILVWRRDNQPMTGDDLAVLRQALPQRSRGLFKGRRFGSVRLRNDKSGAKIRGGFYTLSYVRVKLAKS